MLSTSTVWGLRERHIYEDEFQQHAKEAILCGGSVMLGKYRHSFSTYFEYFFFLNTCQGGTLRAHWQEIMNQEHDR